MSDRYSRQTLFPSIGREGMEKIRSEHLTEATETGGVGIKEQGILNTFTNVFKSRGDELRSKFESLGMSPQEAEQYEVELDKGRLVLVATND